jgi:hypothetical protein
MSIDNLQLLVKKRFLRSASLSHPHTPKAIAFQHLQTRSHPHSPKAIPTERFAIALPHPKTAIASPTPQKRFLRSASLSHFPTPQKRFLRSASLSHSQHPQQAIPTERFAIALPTSPKAITLPHPKSDRLSIVYS